MGGVVPGCRIAVLFWWRCGWPLCGTVHCMGMDWGDCRPGCACTWTVPGMGKVWAGVIGLWLGCLSERKCEYCMYHMSDVGGMKTK